jgi:predicted restriction endonuclease
VVERVGQNLFRKALLEYWNHRCPLTGISEPALLRASHIVPWAECDDDAHRLDVHNGLLLSALWDAAFDAGLISFSNQGEFLFHHRLSEIDRQFLLHGAAPRLTGLTTRHLPNLARHRDSAGFV